MDNSTETTLKEVTKTLPVLKHIKDLYQAATTLDQQRQAHQTVRASKAGSSGKAIALGGGVGTFFVLDFIFIFLVNNGLLWNVGVYIVCSFIASFGVYFFLKRRVQTKQDVENREESQQVDTKIAAISREIYNYTVQNQAVIDVLPRDYRYYDAAEFFESALANGRADSMKEAINLYELHLHQLQMESNSRQMLEQQRMQSNMLANIEASANSAAMNSGIAATFSVLNFISRV